MRDLALALANLQLVEAKTADPQRLERLELDEPGADGAKSRLIELLGGDGATLAAAVVGKASPSLYGGGRGGVYVRRAADNQAWLAGGELDLPADAMTLIGSELVDVPMDQVARVVVQPPGGAAATLSRPDVSADFVTDATLPEGRKLDPVKVEIARRRPVRADHGPMFGRRRSSRSRRMRAASASRPSPAVRSMSP